MSLLSSKYQDIDENLLIDRDEADRKSVMSKRTQWASFENTYISKTEVELMKSFESGAQNLDDLLQRNGTALAQTFLVLLAKLQRPEDLSYILTLLHDLLVNQPSSIQYFYKFQEQKSTSDFPFGPFLTLLERRDDAPYILSKASSIVALFLVNFPTVKPDNVEKALGWFIKKLGERNPNPDTDHRIKSKVLENLRTVLKSHDLRLAFAKESGLDLLFELSKYEAKQVNGRTIELLYVSLYCIWLLSFHPAVKKSMTHPALLSNLCLLLRTCQEKDKVVRMSLAILRNLLHVHRNNQLMISFGLDRLIQQIKTKPASMSDKDVVEDVETLEQELDKMKDELSSFDVYHSEVEGRNLEWSSPTHKSEKFWMENSLKIEDSNLLEILRDILENEQSTDVLCVACWDIGEFVRFHPQGKGIVHRLDIKTPIMKLLSHSDSEVRNQALLTLQKVMITNWEYLQG